MPDLAPHFSGGHTGTVDGHSVAYLELFLNALGCHQAAEELWACGGCCASNRRQSKAWTAANLQAIVNPVTCLCEQSEREVTQRSLRDLSNQQAQTASHA